MKTRLRYTYLILLLVAVPMTSLADGLPPKEKLCPNNDCRGPITIRLIKEDGTTFEQKNEYFYPVVQSFGITILAGEQIGITGDFENNKLVNIRALTDKDKVGPLMSFVFQQEDAKMMILSVENHSKHNIKYHLLMMPLDKEELYKTSSCPVLAGKTAYESWPYPIYQLLIPEVFVVEGKDAMNCEY